jgi:anaerobic magnesium-protoporphyrin IX monomethyl ester cyclase
MKVVLGGPQATCDPLGSLERGFDYVIVDEGEKACLKLLQGKTSKFIIKEPFIKNLNDIPFPDRNAVNIHNYKYFIDGEKATTAITSRGCFYNCAFCCKTWGNIVRFRSARNVLQEMNEIQR